MLAWPRRWVPNLRWPPRWIFVRQTIVRWRWPEWPRRFHR